MANWAYQRRFARWRIDRSLHTGASTNAAIAGGALMAVIYPLMVYRFSARQVAGFITDFPTTRKIGLRDRKLRAKLRQTRLLARGTGARLMYARISDTHLHLYFPGKQKPPPQ